LREPPSERELDVLRLLATHLDGPDVRRTLHVSLNRLRTHSCTIFRALQAASRPAGVQPAMELDLLARHPR
jgi:LuxR family maltose regulon positive regulatory protein